MHLEFTQAQWDNVFGALQTMRADGMSSEDSDTPLSGGVVLRKRNAAWRSEQLQDFLDAVRLHNGLAIEVPYVDKGSPGMRPAPAGLSAAFYAPEYLMGLSPTAREELNIKE